MNAKLFMMIAAAACGMGFASCDDDDYINLSDLPAAIQEEFSTRYPAAQIEEWEIKNGYTKVDFRSDGYEAEAWFGTNGWVMTETDIPYQALPAPVRTSFETSDYADWHIEDIDMVDRINSQTVYVIEVERGNMEFNLHYSKDGILIKDQQNQGGDNSYLPGGQTPADIESKVKEMYPNAVIIEVENINGNIEVDIIHENIGKEVVFTSAGEWIYTSWDIRLGELPDIIRTAVNNSYPNCRIDDVDFYQTPTGNYYDVEIEMNDRDQHIRVSESGEILK